MSTGQLFDAGHGGMAPSLNDAGAVALLSAGASVLSDTASLYTYDLDVHASTPGVYTLSVPQGVVAGSGSAVFNCPASVQLQLGFELALSLRETVSGGKTNVDAVWHAGDSGPTVDTLLVRATAAGGAPLAAIASYTTVPAPPDYAVFHSPAVGGVGGAWSLEAPLYYELTLPLTSFVPGQYRYTLLQGVFKDTNGARAADDSECASNQPRPDDAAAFAAAWPCAPARVSAGGSAAPTASPGSGTKS